MKQAKQTQPIYPVTDEHIKQFTSLVYFWQNVLGLNDWRIRVSTVRAKRVMAEVYKLDLEQRSATIRLGPDFGPTEVNERSLSDTALHEVLHIFLREFRETASKGDDVSWDDLHSIEHRVINVLERVLSNASPLGPRT